MTKKIKQTFLSKGEIAIYHTKSGKARLDVTIEKDTVWLNQAQIAALFGIERSVITKHLTNIFKNRELDKKSNVQKMHITTSDKPVSLYNLDVVLSVGYRVNSVRATQFRIWATQVLRDHLIQGCTINQKRLLEQAEKFKELQKTISFLKNKASAPLLADQGAALLELLDEYTNSLTLLFQYDQGTLQPTRRKKPKISLKYEECKKVIEQTKTILIKKKEASDLFGQEYGEKFKGILGLLYQTFGGKELYASVEEKAAHLLYLTIKDHPFVDGNKRLGSFLFVYFLDSNQYLYKKSGERKITDTTLVALALLIAMSDPKEKTIMITLITNLLV